MSTNPMISIVTPSLDQGHYIGETIASIASQDYTPFEHIVVDGASTDGTLDVLRGHQHLSHLRWLSEPDSGQSEAINKGIRLSKGEIIAYLNADDFYRPGAFRAVRAAFAADPACGVVFGDCDEVDGSSNVTGIYRARLSRPDDLLHHWAWGSHFCIAQPAVFLRRGLLDQVGLFDETFELAMDYEMWLRLASRTRFKMIPRTLAAFRVTCETKSQRRPYELLMEAYFAARRHRRLAPMARRLQLVIQSKRETAGHLLTLAEESLHRVIAGPSARRMALTAGSLWPIMCCSPRLWRLVACRNKSADKTRRRRGACSV